jgi:hypothetical protein
MELSVQRHQTMAEAARTFRSSLLQQMEMVQVVAIGLHQ